jgi:exodeoxyribonuclease VII large subunit
LQEAAFRRVDRASQRLDQAAAHLGRPSSGAAQQHVRIERQAQRLRHALAVRLQRSRDELGGARDGLGARIAERLAHAHRRSDRIELRLQLLDPRLVLQRGYALLTDAQGGHPITSARDAHAGQQVRAALSDGEVDLLVLPGGGIRP